MNNKPVCFLVGVVFAAFGFASGFWVGARGGSLTGAPLKQQVGQLQDQLDRAKKALPPIAEHTFAISGTVESIAGSVLTLDANLFNPLKDLPRVRKVTITSATVITKLERKDPQAYQRELAGFLKTSAPAPANGKTPESSQGLNLFPSPFREVPGSLADIKQGQSVNVIAGEDVADKESFEARAIQVSVTPYR